MEAPIDQLRPSDFCRYSLKALEASEGRSKRRKRDQTPDAIGMAIKRELLLRAMEDDPEPGEFEAWLMAQVTRVPAGGPVRAMCGQILDEYRFASLDPNLGRWLVEGARSDDAQPGRPKSDAEVYRA